MKDNMMKGNYPPKPPRPPESPGWSEARKDYKPDLDITPTTMKGNYPSKPISSYGNYKRPHSLLPDRSDIIFAVLVGYMFCMLCLATWGFIFVFIVFVFLCGLALTTFLWESRNAKN